MEKNKIMTNIKKYKVLIRINIILLFSLIVCIFFLLKQCTRKDTVKEVVIELLDGMIKETHDDFSEHFKYYEMRTFFINEQIDSLYILMNQEDIFCSFQLMNYYNQIVNDSIETKAIFNALYSMKDKQSQDFILLYKLMEYRFIKKVIEDSGYLGFCWFDGVGVSVCSNKDVIQIGEEYIAVFSYSGDIFNKEQQPIVVLDGDTLNAKGGYCKFKERPQKKGLIKHKGYMTYFHHNAGIVEYPLEFEYYVK